MKKKSKVKCMKVETLLLCLLLTASFVPFLIYRFDPALFNAMSPREDEEMNALPPPKDKRTNATSPQPLRLTEYAELPQWTKEYFNWHSEQRALINTAENISALPTNMRFLVVQCTDRLGCGGLADRLRPLPCYIFIAAQTSRVLLIRWQTPCKLEHFLVPPEGVGIDWRVPDWMGSRIHKTSDLRSLGQADEFVQDASNATFVTTGMQLANGGMYHYDDHYAGNASAEAVFKAVFGGMFQTLFTPSPDLDSLIKQRMSELHLVPGEYAGVHVRARYPNHIHRDKEKQKQRGIADKEGGFPFRGDIKKGIITVATNAINCAIHVMPNASIYFASDSDGIVDYMTTESPFTTDGIVNILSQKHRVEPIHLDTKSWGNLQPSDFYPAFLDLWLLGKSRCSSLGRGNFGKFANLLSYNHSCWIRHRNYKGIIDKCPSALSRDVWDADKEIGWYNQKTRRGNWDGEWSDNYLPDE